MTWYVVTRTITETVDVEADNVEDAIIRAEEADEYDWDGNREDPSYVAQRMDDTCECDGHKCDHGLATRTTRFGKEHMVRVNRALGAKVWEQCK